VQIARGRAFTFAASARTEDHRRNERYRRDQTHPLMDLQHVSPFIQQRLLTGVSLSLLRRKTQIRQRRSGRTAGWGVRQMKRTIALLSLAAACLMGTAIAQTNNNFLKGNIKRVLLISVDGMHAVDFLNCANGISTINNGQPFCPALAALGKTGINYVAASTSKTSDSFPGLTAIVTGGSPAYTGIYYDVAYSRNYDAPAKTTGNGLGAGPCTPFAAPTGHHQRVRRRHRHRPDQVERRRAGRIADRRRHRLDRLEKTDPRPK
jgi:hypothetical protein